GLLRARNERLYPACFAHHASHAFAADASSGGMTTGAPCLGARLAHRERSVASSSVAVAVDIIVANIRFFTFSSTKADETTTTASRASTDRHVVLATRSARITTAATAAPSSER